ncbi:hypothetical protein BVRB_020550 [Beta vulgaris subsp. vulgaris]|uniref:Uncharacterized protein n=1 Tax=Beta vulgaris subsp. vulgaris TaxID=3555 RepID=A0A0J8B0M1_BETVV|nr:hypothetical protein BVRB_020550 [Beta vulgaris subsp. vulgaris]
MLTKREKEERLLLENQKSAVSKQKSQCMRLYEQSQTGAPDFAGHDKPSRLFKLAGTLGARALTVSEATEKLDTATSLYDEMLESASILQERSKTKAHRVRCRLFFGQVFQRLPSRSSICIGMPGTRSRCDSDKSAEDSEFGGSDIVRKYTERSNPITISLRSDRHRKGLNTIRSRHHLVSCERCNRMKSFG